MNKMEYANRALQLASEQVETRESNLERQKAGLAWLDAWLHRLPQVSHIHCFQDGEIAVTFVTYGEESTSEKIAAEIRAALRVQQSAKEADAWSEKSLRLVTIAPTDSCLIRLIVPGAEITQGCKLEPQTFTTYKLVCK